MAAEKDYYRLLGVSREAPEREIKKAYYELARKLHPDKAKSKEEGEKNASSLALMSQAYNTLKDPNKREEYDKQLRGKSPSSPGAPSAPAAVAQSPVAATTSTDSSSAPAGPVVNQQDIIAQKKNMAQKAFVKGMQFYKKQEYQKALTLFETAAKHDPDSEPQYHLKYAQCLVSMKRSFMKAVESAAKACEMDPYNVDFKLVLGEIHELAGSITRAREVYEEVLRWDAANERAKMRLELLNAVANSKKSFLDKIKDQIFKKR